MLLGKYLAKTAFHENRDNIDKNVYVISIVV